MPLVNDLHEVEGYKHCRNGCGSLVVEYVADQTTGLCMDCFDAGLGDVRLAEVMVRGATVMIPTTSKKKKKPKKRPTNTTVEHAKRSAMRRLAKLHPDMYAMLYDEERVRRGLPPVVRRDRRALMDVASETLSFESVYDALRLSGETDA